MVIGNGNGSGNHRSRFIIDSHRRAGNGTRSRDPNLGKVVLYQLSYSRVLTSISGALGTDKRRQRARDTRVDRSRRARGSGRYAERVHRIPERVREQTSNGGITAIRFRAPILVNLFGGEPVIERSSAYPLHHLGAVGTEQTRALLDEKAAVSGRCAHRPTVRGLVTIDHLVHRQPVHRRERIIREHSVAVQIDGGRIRRLTVLIAREVSLQRGA